MNGLGPDFEPELEKRRLFRNALTNENAKELRKNPVKEPCEVSPTGNIVLYGLQNIQGFTGFENARILVQNQTDKKENGIYYMRTDAWVRSYDANTSASTAYQIYKAGVLSKFIRGRISTAGVGGTLNYISIKTRGQ